MNKANIEYENIEKQQIEFTHWLKVSQKSYHSILARQNDITNILIIFKNGHNYHDRFVKIIEITQSQLKLQKKKEKLLLIQNFV